VDDLLLMVACDHTDRDLEVHGVAWSKQSAPNILGDVAWSLVGTRRSGGAHRTNYPRAPDTAMTPEQHGEPRRHVQVTCAQLDGHDREPDARLRQARETVAQHRRRITTNHDDAESLVVLPELWPVGFFHFRDYAAAAQGLDGEVVTSIREAAREHRVWVLGGSFIERSPAGLHNTAFLVDPAGELVLTYRKMHLFGYPIGGGRPSGRRRRDPVCRHPVGTSRCDDLL
jgi:apolipoprotein N-acyltransferase